MRTMPAELMGLIVIFEPLFTKPTWEQAKILILGALLARGKRTVTACLRVVGLSEEKHFQNYHRVLNRAKWETLKASKIMLGLLVMLVPASGAVVIGADDTIERRRGRKIKGVGCYRDPVASSRKNVVKCFGLKWLSMMVCVRLPWTKRVWALPFLTVLCRAEQEGQKQKVWHTHRRRKRRPNKQRQAEAKRQAAALRALPKSTPRQHKTSVDILMILGKLLHRWLPERLIVLTVDGGYAAVKLALRCAGIPNLELVTRLRWKATLYHPPAPQPEGKSGPKPLKGVRQRSLKVWAARSDTPWQEAEVAWYAGTRKTMLLFSRTALWHTEGEVPVAIRYVITRDPEGKLRDEVFATTKLDATPEQIIEWVVCRWSVEVTFEEAREHLGMETQRQWNDLAIARTTPCLLGLFSLVVLLTSRLHPDGAVPVRSAAWYDKPDATFSDCLFLVRKHLWRSCEYTDSAQKADSVYFPTQVWDHLLSCLAGAA
ncbi:MAG: transposase [Blastocatellales bacterium]|nr:transposase [Blastocatellales bacterium]MCW5970373.1 transposase [Blastocatellales bacterium]MCW5971153.1 transposase [Blastocatellales bacterium]